MDIVERMHEPRSVMRQEIDDQPAALARTLDALADSLPAMRELRDRRFTSVLLIARGTSDHVADYAQYLFPCSAGLIATSASPSVAVAFRARVPLHGAIAIAISQSGATVEIVETAIWAKSMGAFTVGISNVAGSPLAGVVDLPLITQAGPEVAVPATKTYTSALATIAYLAAVLGDQSGLMTELFRMPEIMQMTLDLPWDLERAAAIFSGSNTAVLTGRGFTAGVARESALKLKETSGINAVGASVADLVHGPIAALVSGLPVACFSPGVASPIAAGLEDLVQRAAARHCRILTIGPHEALQQSSEVHVNTPAVSEELAPFPLIVPGQLLAERVARLCGMNPDEPTGLHKITQTT